MKISRSEVLRLYLFPVLLVGVAFGVTYILYVEFGLRVPFLLPLAAIAVSAGYGGLIPGVTATLLSSLLLYSFLLVHDALRPELERKELIEVTLFAIVGVLLSVLCEVLLTSQRRTEAARQESENARRRIAFLADANTLLDATLDYETTLMTVARLAVPQFGDWCAISVLEEDQTLRQLAVTHRTPEKEAAVRDLQHRYPLNANGQPPLQKVLRSGETDLYQDIPDSALVSAARDADHLALLRTLDIRTYLCVPLTARGRVLGAAMLGSERRHRFTASDRALVEDLARRAALAVDNARLYRIAQDAESELQTANERLRRAMTETHHRVKNNLQIIAAMIDLQTMQERELIPSEEFVRLASSVRTLAAVHDILTHEAKGEGEMHFVSSQTVLDKLLSLMQETNAHRRIRYQVADLRLTAKQGASVALVVNELVSNAIKHGNSDVDVTFTGRGDGKAALVVLDDGAGFPPDFDPVRAANTGLELVLSLTKWDLNGQVCYDNRPEGGGRVTILMPIPAGE